MDSKNESCVLTFFFCKLTVHFKCMHGIIKCTVFLKDFIYLFLERGEGREKEMERNISVWLPLMRPLLGIWPATQACALDWELNQWLFGSQAGTQSTEPHQPWLNVQYFLFYDKMGYSDLKMYPFLLEFSSKRSRFNSIHVSCVTLRG